MSRGVSALLLLLAMTLLLIYSVAGSSALSGPLLFTVSATHGVHRDDLVALGAWLLGVYCVLRLLRS
ncbi:hypothetical protein [Nocardioides daejeonensis]|uniref:hypothetical protein n=1 Tax=Nocardioides daejeonensis TaxID=1046556 RepID=UPI0013A530DA|nr:hypothetical protein [Nocardioides daejeonensis]